MIKGYMLVYYKKFEDEWYERTVNCTAMEDVEKFIEEHPNIHRYKLTVLRDTYKK